MSQPFVLLLRGVNVGGRNKLPMADLRELLCELGAEDVSTYIQSGNAVLSLPAGKAKTFSQKLKSAFGPRYPFIPLVFLIARADYVKTLQKNPFSDIEDDPKKLHVAFLAAPPKAAALEKVEAALSKTESLSVAGKAIYFHAPDGIGRSKAAEKLNTAFPEATVRNWRTCVTLQEMAEAL